MLLYRQILLFISILNFTGKMNPAVVPPVLKNNPLKLSQVVFCIRTPREIYHNTDFRENVSS